MSLLQPISTAYHAAQEYLVHAPRFELLSRQVARDIQSIAQEGLSRREQSTMRFTESPSALDIANRLASGEFQVVSYRVFPDMDGANMTLDLNGSELFVSFPAASHVYHAPAPLFSINDESLEQKHGLFSELSIIFSQWRKHFDSSVNSVIKPSNPFTFEQWRGFSALPNRGLNPLHVAADFNHVELAEFSLTHGVEIDGKDIEGNTPLHYAMTVRGDGSSIAKMISSDDKNDTINFDVAEFLIQRGASVAIKNNDGKTPLDLVAGDDEALAKIQSLLLRQPTSLRRKARSLEIPGL